MKRMLAMALLAALGACGTPQTDSYALSRGSLSYDELRRETEACRARGGTIQPVQNGGDMGQLSNYVCVIPRGS